MYLHYGNYRSGFQECTVSIDRQVVENEAGQPYGIDHTWRIQGQIQADSTSEVVAAYQLLEVAFSRWGLDMWLADSNGTVCHQMRSSGSITGVKIVKPPSYPTGEGAQLSTFRDYEIVATCRYPYGPGNLLRSFREILSFSGGGPERDVLECVNAPPQEQLLKRFTAYRAIQQGEAVGMYGTPPIPGPIFPGKEKRVSFPTGDPSYSSPKLINGNYVDWGVSWRYEFVSATPLVGMPNVWPAG